MVVKNSKIQSSVERWSIAAAILACIFNLSCLVLLNYQDYLRTETIVTNYPEMVSDCFLMAPMIVVIIFRRVAAVTITYASMLSVVLAGRIYYIVRFHLIGISALEPKLDPPGLLLILLGAVSFVVLLIWVITQVATLISFVLKRRNGAGTDG
jgi:hypothetical protein